MRTLLDSDGRFTEDGVQLLRKVMALLRPVFSEFIEKGYTLDDIAQQVHQAVDFVKRE
jgi:hypothetical protein